MNLRCMGQPSRPMGCDELRHQSSSAVGARSRALPDVEHSGSRNDGLDSYRCLLPGWIPVWGGMMRISSQRVAAPVLAGVLAAALLSASPARAHEPATPGWSVTGPHGGPTATVWYDAAA